MNSNTDFDIKKWLIEQSELIVDAIELLEKAVNENNEDDSVQAVKQLNDLGNRLTDYLPNLENDDKAYGHFMMGSICSALRMWSEARYAYETSLEIWPDHVGLLNEYFITLFELQEFEKAVEVIKKSIVIGGETPDVIQNLAVALFSKGDKEEAKMTLINGMAKFPTYSILKKTLEEMESAHA